MRIFISIAMPETVKKELIKLQAELKILNKAARISWTRKNNFHLTLCFLGDFSPASTEQVKTILSEICEEFKPIKLVLAEPDGFPNKTRPKILNVKIYPDKALLKLRNDLCQRLIRAGLLKKADFFKPHITVGRQKTDLHIDGLRSLKIKKINWNAEKIYLMRSNLTAAGSIYNAVASYNLKTND